MIERMYRSVGTTWQTEEKGQVIAVIETKDMPRTLMGKWYRFPFKVFYPSDLPIEEKKVYCEGTAFETKEVNREIDRMLSGKKPAAIVKMQVYVDRQGNVGESVTATIHLLGDKSILVFGDQEICKVVLGMLGEANCEPQNSQWFSGT